MRICTKFNLINIAGNPGSPARPLLPEGQDKSLSYFITCYFYEKSINLSWVPGG